MMMSHPIRVSQFVVSFLLYVLASFIIFMTSSFSSLSWLFGIFLLLPFYLLCGAGVASLQLTKRGHRVKFNPYLIGPIALFQALMVLFSPASCYGWSQGKACYSLIQAYLGGENLQTLGPGPAHWELIESLFPPVVFLYMVALVAFLALVRIQPPDSHSHR